MDMDATSGPDANQSRRRGPSIFVRQVLLYLVFILLVVGIAGRLFFAADDERPISAADLPHVLDAVEATVPGAASPKPYASPCGAR